MIVNAFSKQFSSVANRAGIRLAALALAWWMAVPQPALAHTLVGEVVLVDTDSALDDLRALALLVDLPGIEVLGVVTCEGSSEPDDGAWVVQAFLDRLDRAGIPVYAGSQAVKDPPPWRPLYDKLAEMARREPISRKPGKDWKAGITRLISSSKKPVTVMALGPLTNLAKLVAERPALKNRIAKVIWYGALSSGIDSFNRDFDPASAAFMASSGIPLIQIHAPAGRDKRLVFDSRMLSDLTIGDTSKARALHWLFGLEEARSLLDQEHFPIWDELVPLWLARPELFHEQEGVLVPDATRITRTYLQLFRGPAGKPPGKDTEAFDPFPADPAGYRADIGAMVPELIDRYGPDEFRGCVLVSELHQHLGLYSIIGVKMSIRAREVLGEVDHPLRVTSWAGLRPPFSCLNDGLQVGAGATTGLGLLNVHKPAKPRIEATFVGGGKKVTLVLNKDVQEAIRRDISKLKSKHKGFTSDYYRDLRGVAIRYWRDLDRNRIFDVR